MEWFGVVAKAVVGVVVAIGTMMSATIAGPAQPSAPPTPPAVSRVAVDAATSRVIVRFRASASAAAVDGARRAAGASDHAAIRQLGARVFIVPDSRVALAALRGSAAVEYAEADSLLAPTDTLPNDPYFPTGTGSLNGGQWGLFKTQAPKAWDVTTGSSGVLIADIDSGVALVPDLVGQVVQGYNVLDGTTNTADTYGHGTYVAGVIAAATNNGAGIAGYCWSCRLMPVKVYSTSAGAYVSDIAAGMTWAVDHGARVLNISLGGPNTSTTLSNAVSYARQSGTVVVAAAGNSGCDCLTYPAAITGVVGVAGSDQTDTLFSYSNYGSWVPLAAPGSNLTTWPDGSYVPVGGTSMAAPVVAGIAGLLFSRNPSATPDMVAGALFGSIDPVAGTHRVVYGRVNAYSAVAAIASSTPTPTPSQTPSPSVAPSPSPTPPPSVAPSPTPIPAPTQAPVSISTTFSGALTPKNNSRSFSLTSGAGVASATLSYSKSNSLSIAVYGPDGTILLSQTGASPLSFDITLTGGMSQFTVSGTTQSSFTLTVSYPAP